MRFKDNTIIFDENEARLYDDTRPFTSDRKVLKIFDHIFTLLNQQRRENPRIIKIIDLGCGTGRLAIPLATQYSNYIAALRNAPKLKLTCMDMSREMLDVLEKKWRDTNDVTKKSVELNIAERDIRSLGIEDEKYDAAIAHWIFHLMEDWRIASYAIDRIINPSGLIFLCTEKSSLYSAIDGDIRNISDPLLRRFWQTFLLKRAKIDSFSPKHRLGSLVVDDKIHKMFQAIGWERQANTYKFQWENNRTIDWIIEHIIKARSFTNMQLYIDQVAGKTAYEKISNELIEIFEKELKYEWNFSTSFEIQYYLKTTRNINKCHRIIFDVAKATVGHRWHTMNYGVTQDAPLWSRLIKSTWNRINLNSDDEEVPLGGLSVNDRRNVTGIFMSAPAILPLGNLQSSYWIRKDINIVSKYSEKLWDELTYSIESTDPLVICIGQSERIIDSICRNWENENKLFPPLTCLLFDSNTITGAQQKLNRLRKDAKYFFRLKELIRADVMTEVWCQDILQKASTKGIIGYDFENDGIKFLSAITRLIFADIPITYIFPSVLAEKNRKFPALGFFVTAEDPISGKTTNMLWSLGEILFSEYERETRASALETIQIKQTQPRLELREPEKKEAEAIVAQEGESKEQERTIFEFASNLLSVNDNIKLRDYVIVGDYVRSEEDNVILLRGLYRSIYQGCINKTNTLENYLIWARSGRGKTFLFKQIAEVHPDIEFIEIDLKNTKFTHDWFNNELQKIEKDDKPILCIFDEIDTKKEYEWIYEAIHDCLDKNRKKRTANIPNKVFILIGSTPNINALKDHIMSRHKGIDILNRIDNIYIIPDLDLSDKLIVTLAQINRESREQKRNITSVQKKALFYILVNDNLDNMHKLQNFVKKAIKNLPENEETLAYDDLFARGDPKKYQFRKHANGYSKNWRKQLFYIEM